MPLVLANFPADPASFNSLVADPRRGFGYVKNDVLGLTRKLDQFWHDAYFQTIPKNLVSEYCRALAELINEVLFEHYYDKRPAMWHLTRELLEKAGLTEVKVKSATDFYSWAGPGKPASDLANHMFIGCWH